MQIQSLEDSGILLKDQDFISFIQPEGHVEHEPITHSNQKQRQQMAAYKNFVKTIEVQQRKKMIEKSDKIKKELLEAQISTKNFRHEIQRPSTQFENNRDYTDTKQSSNNKESKQVSVRKFAISRNQKSESTNIQKTKSNMLKIQPTILKGQPYVNKEKLMKKAVFPQTEKQNWLKEPKQFSGIRLRNIKLPELNTEAFHHKTQPLAPQKPKAEKPKQVIIISKQKKVKKQQGNFIFNPVLKTFDSRYFGIDRTSKDYEKMGKNLVQQIMEKYWCYQTIENEQVCQNFQHFLAEQIDSKQ